MASLTGNKVKDTYQSLLKTNDNGQVTSVSKNITDGFGSGSGLYLKDTGVLLSGSVALSGIIPASQANILTYDTASGQIYYTASSAIGGGATTSFTSSFSEYYVDKRFSGSCSAVINSNRSITSTNANYLTQLSASRVGDPNNPYPDPWSAGFAASASIAAGTIRNARVIVKTGNEYTYGSTTLGQNGDMTGSLVNNLTADIAVSQTDYNIRAFDLLSPMVEYYFEPEAALYNINKSWTQELVFYTSSDWNIAPEFKITGQGKFVLVYGRGTFIARYGTIVSPRAEILIEADQLLQNRDEGWQLIGQKIDINIDRWWSYPAYVLSTNAITATYLYDDAFWNWPSQSLAYPSYSIGLPIVNVNIKDYRWGVDLFGGLAPWNDSGFGSFVVGHPYGCLYNYNITNLTTKGRHADGFFRFVPPAVNGLSAINNSTFINNNVNIRMLNVSASRDAIRGTHMFATYQGIGGSLNTPVTRNIFYENCNWYIDIGKMEANAIGLGSSRTMANRSNCTFKLHCDDYRNYGLIDGESAPLESQPCLSFIELYNNSSSLTPLPSGSYRNNQIIISGNYRNYSAGSLLTYTSANRFGTDATLGSTLILDNFNGYQLNQIPGGYGAIGLINWSTAFWPNYVYSTGSLMIVKNSTVYVSGSAPIFSNTISPAKTPTILLNNVSSNKDVSGSFNFDGSLNVSSNIANIFY